MDWTALISTFGLLLVAELGDKTQLAVVTQVCKHRRPWAVFLGATSALVLVTALGAVGGNVLARVVPPAVLRIVAAAAFVVLGVLIGRQALRARGGGLSGAACETEQDLPLDCAPVSAWDWKAFASTFGLLFVAELGDKTQLAVFSMAGKYGSVGSVFAGGALALTAVTALGVLGGQGLCRIIPERLLLWISAAAFVVMGVLVAVGVL